MPIINEQKYSCEPCIRGHRATSCKHSDRLMVLVRKPGRPTQGCGHTFQTCYCRSFENIFSIGGVEESVPITTSLKSKLGVRKNKSKAPKGRSFQFQEVQGGIPKSTNSHVGRSVMDSMNVKTHHISDANPIQVRNLSTDTDRRSCWRKSLSLRGRLSRIIGCWSWASFATLELPRSVKRGLSQGWIWKNLRVMIKFIESY
ncbi:hypothetical protein EYC84_009776 [Monilinia fructicola]|uniref:Copper-fist domain-containing protein n=1 Tax=Monilinia fructicola TaxID=38448 RepID=A0A5M9J8M5_MONFR|nr:hypothetical protein EYC84_009776 [Monilinia fructicola]